jgi:hypothetical protein
MRSDSPRNGIMRQHQHQQQQQQNTPFNKPILICFSHYTPHLHGNFMLKSSQTGRKATSGKETDSLACASGGLGASGSLPPLPRAGSVTPSSSSSKAKNNQGLEYSKTRQRNLR